MHVSYELYFNKKIINVMNVCTVTDLNLKYKTHTDKRQRNTLLAKGND